MNRVQIVEMKKGEKRWRFVAHGAAYDRSEAEDMKNRALARGDKIRFLSVGRE